MFKNNLAWVKLTPPIPPEQRNRTSSTSKEKVVEVMPRATCFDLNRDDFAVVGYEDGYTQVWDLRTIQSMVKLLDPFTDEKENVGRTVSVRWSPTKDFHVIVLHQQYVFVWDLQSPLLKGPMRIVHLKEYSDLVTHIIPVHNDVFFLLREEEQKSYVYETSQGESTKKKRRKLNMPSSVCRIKGILAPSKTSASIERVNLFNGNDGSKCVVSIIFMKEKNLVLAVRSDCAIVLLDVSEQQQQQEMEIIDSTIVVSSKRLALGA